ncbi:MAG: hypothetical protein A3K04_05110 [Gallionellales bacterium RBG_16_56_9]|nr:MAG: hypothetical protein A3K04_05110 [Gallionellales bacterium RBG_16_56_9]
MEAARGDYVLFLNNDAFLPTDALDRFAEDFASFPQAALIGGQLVGENGVPQRSAGVAPTFFSELGLVRRKQPDVSNSPQPVEVETLVGACMAFRRALVDTAGRLDEDSFLRRQGRQVVVNPRVRITHHASQGSKYPCYSA